MHRQVQRRTNRRQDLYLVLQCYVNLDPAVPDSAFMACRGDFPNKPDIFVGSMFFGYDAPKGYSMTNLETVESGTISSAFFAGFPGSPGKPGAS